MTRTDIHAAFALAVAEHQGGRLQQAAVGYRRVLAAQPDNADALHLLGIIENGNGRHDLSVQLIARAVELMERSGAPGPNYINAINNLGNALRDQGNLQGAIAAYRRALDLNPAYHEAHNNLGNALKDSGRLKEAISSYERALAIAPDYADAIVNLGNARREQGLLDEASHCYRRALALDPRHAGAHSNLAMVLLARGEFSRGWAEYEWRWEANHWMRRPFPYPTWENQALRGKTVLVYAEQGIGDEIMFASCLPELISEAGHVVVECDSRLVPLFRRAFPQAEITDGRQRGADLSWLAKLPAIDLKVAAGSLPLHLRRDLNAFPAHGGYLVPDQDRLSRWHERYASLGGGTKIGISWRGGRGIVDRLQRSVALDRWTPVLRIPGVHYINLQYGDCTGDIGAVTANPGVNIHDWDDADPLQDLDDFAAQIAALDLVISVDNSTVHMAGSLGVPVWVLQPFCGDWRWLRGRTHSYWYPSLRQFWQTEPGAWGPVMKEVAAELSTRAGIDFC